MSDPERLYSAADAQKVLGIPSATVRSWARRQGTTDLLPYGLDERGHPMFRESDLVALKNRNTRAQR